MKFLKQSSLKLPVDILPPVELPVDIPAPPPQSALPDKETKKAPFTKGDGQVFHFQKGGLSYGTDDKGHAAALVLSVLLFIGLIFCVIVGALTASNSIVLEIGKIMGSAFLIVSGIAVGKSIENKK